MNNQPFPHAPTYLRSISRPLSSSTRQNIAPTELLTGIIDLVAMLLALVESVVLLLLLDVGSGDVPLVSGLVDLGVAHVVGCAAHFDYIICCFGDNVCVLKKVK